ncbi:MAG TPA: molybdate ABC transporter substrate-binding protein [Ferrovibrio sp.]|uniref:molybdate ABC transporter substrate-binding protein n=1 Tax=Ferrovibrio sp. TaxID=1917215 RepID=UPI002ED01BF1
MRRIAFLAALILPIATAPAARADALLVFAAASLKAALSEVDAGWTAQQRAGKREDDGVKVSFAGSSALARQIEAGAPADLFISADLAWMEYLAQRRLVRPGTRVDLLGNRIVLIAPARSALQARIAPGFDLAGLLGAGGRLAIADTDAVPAGRYGKAALQALKVWPQVERRLVQAENVRAALAFVARGEAPLGIVYATDAAAEPKVRIVDAFPEETHPPIVYPAAVLAASRHPAAAAYLSYLQGAAARTVFEKNGFTLPGRR